MNISSECFGKLAKDNVCHWMFKQTCKKNNVILNDYTIAQIHFMCFCYFHICLWLKWGDEFWTPCYSLHNIYQFMSCTTMKHYVTSAYSMNNSRVVVECRPTALEVLGFEPRVRSPRIFKIDFHLQKLSSLSIEYGIKQEGALYPAFCVWF